MNSKEVAQISGVSIRTLHYYDEIGLLSPRRSDHNQYRFYETNDINRLQQILFLKECGFSLKTVKQILDHPNFNQKEAFLLQQKVLLEEKKRIEQLLQTLQKSLAELEGGQKMSISDKFEGFPEENQEYRTEVWEKWGENATKKTDQLDQEGKQGLRENLIEAFQKLASFQNENPEAETVQNEVKNLYQFFCQNVYDYTPEAFAGVGQLYIMDERFTKTMKIFGEGFPEFAAKSMEIFASKK